MKVSKLIMIVALSVFVIACETKDEINPVEDPEVLANDSRDDGTNESNKNENDVKCKTVLVGISENDFNLFAINGSYDECKTLVNANLRFESYVYFDGTSVSQVAREWSGFASVENIDSLVFTIDEKRYSFNSDRARMGSATVIYLSIDEDGSNGLQVNYLDVKECENMFIDMKEDEIRLIEDETC